MPKERSHCICLSVILIDSVFKMGKNYCALKCFYKEKKNKIPIYILQTTQKLLMILMNNDSNEGSSDDSDKENSSEEDNFGESIYINVDAF